MSSATFDASTKRYSAANLTTLWRHLLWKDFRQVLELFIGITVIAICLQLMMGLMQIILPNEMDGISRSAINIALASPTLLAIACSGVLIGQERQTGCWTWSTSLPVSWQQSLMSKFFVWLGASLCTVPILLVVAAIVLSMSGKSLGIELTSGTDLASWTHLMTLLIGVQVFIYLSLATLLIKDTLMAIVIAAFGLFAFHFEVAVVGIGYRLNHENTTLLAYLASFLVGSIGLAATYRWRWGSGQFTSISVLPGRSQSYVRPEQAAWQAYGGAATQPSELWMLMQHGFRSAFWLRVIVFGGALPFISQAVLLVDFGPIVAFLASCVLGASVFSGDQTLKRYRCFADRGADWKRLFASHAVFPGLLTVLLVLYSAFTTERLSAWMIYLLCIPIFVVGMFSSLVFASPIVSISVALIVLCGAFAFTSSAGAVWETVAPGHRWLAIAIWIPVATLLVLVATMRLVPRWLTKDRLNATGTYFGTMLVAGLLPSVFGLSFGFLQIPNVAWQGTPIEQIKGIDWTGGPDLSVSLGSIEIARSELRINSLRVNSGLPTALKLSLSSNVQWPTNEQVGDLKVWLASQEKLLEAIEIGDTGPGTFDVSASAALNRMIEGSAVVALMATEKRQEELAIRAWKANRKIIAFGQQPALQPGTMQSVSFVWEIWNMIKDTDLQFLVDTDELNDLLPVPPPTVEQFRDVLRARATLNRISSRRNSRDLSRCHLTFSSADWYGYAPFQFFPPIRWAYERQQAIALSDDLSINYANPNMYSNLGAHRDPLVNEYSVLTFLERTFAERLRLFQKSQKPSEVH